MSFRVVLWALKQRTGSAQAKLILVTLADFADDEGRCFPSIDAIAERAECSRRNAVRGLDELGALGLVSRARTGRACRYELSIRDANLAHQEPPEEPARDANLAHLMCQPDTSDVPNLHSHIDEPVKEPVIEPSLRAEPAVSTPQADMFRRVRKHLGQPGGSLLAKLRRDGVPDADLLSVIDRYERGEIGDLRQYLGGMSRRGPPNSHAVAYLDRILSGDDPRGSPDRRSPNPDDVFRLPSPQAGRR